MHFIPNSLRSLASETETNSVETTLSRLESESEERISLAERERERERRVLEQCSHRGGQRERRDRSDCRGNTYVIRIYMNTVRQRSDVTKALEHQIELAARIANRIKSLSATLCTLIGAVAPRRLTNSIHRPEITWFAPLSVSGQQQRRDPRLVTAD